MKNPACQSSSKKIEEWTKKWAGENNIPSLFLDQTTSTNDEALYIKEEELFFIFSSRQTKSRGQKGRRWLNSDFMGTWTWLQKKSPKPDLAPYLGSLFYKNASSSWPGPWALKPPNDLYLKEKKAAGFLLEAHSCGQKTRVVLGVGINILKSPRREWAAVFDHSPVNSKNYSQFLSKTQFDLKKIS